MKGTAMDFEIPEKPLLVTGATGYIGGRLVPLLLSRGFKVRALSRSLRKMHARPWSNHPHVELFACDLMDGPALEKAAEGCAGAWYLVHSMEGEGGDFAAREEKTAQNMVQAAEKAGLERIVYLSGLGDEKDPHLSYHLKSRHAVARILSSGKTPVTVLRAAMVLGSGSASFEILRYLVDRLPFMLTPRWIRTSCQPIGIRNTLEYLVGAMVHPDMGGETFDIGGPDVLSYQDLMQLYAEEAGLKKRMIIPVPFQTPGLSAFWVHLVCPLPAGIAKPLAEGLRNPVVCGDMRIAGLIPQKLLSCREAIREAIRKVAQEEVETRWSDAGKLLPPEWVQCTDPSYSGGTILDCCYKVKIRGNAENIWQKVASIGGKNGWYYGDILWRIRGRWDQITGGVGLRRGRRHPEELLVGDALDFWRVLDVKPCERLLLLAEMRLPGEALLEFRMKDLGDGHCELQQMSRFLPKGLLGIVYWYALLPFHHLIFKGMLGRIAEASGKPAGNVQAFSYDWKEQVCSLEE
ncbi:SDR family oxidoreductase [Desulfobotulus sp.]|uniref:SDR family oxidoreductase n=1 Tax=Desulfobotulus sp. TaxID=1940337 RepID=UPI002A359C0D|nr:SDR family oxidoreductase [Desulfobotulus sp.]MDY0164340.1 SDR family oxidoreductase [Desulfobotulus sp.]